MKNLIIITILLSIMHNCNPAKAIGTDEIIRLRNIQRNIQRRRQAQRRNMQEIPLETEDTRRCFPKIDRETVLTGLSAVASIAIVVLSIIQIFAKS